MLNIEKEKNGNDLVYSLSGRLDMTSASELETELKQDMDGLAGLTFDLSHLDYISSAGLRVLLFAHKIMKKQGSMVIKNASEDVMEIFKVTGFADILTIE